jgi:hypothetical protein
MEGIASLPVSADESTEMELGSGIGGAVTRLQEMGRNGDTIIAHLTPDEIVVPADILKQNPQVKDMIFAEMRLAGVEDPERFIVGSDANFINPDSGLPEFFLKNIIRGVRKAVKNVGNALKKAAPVVLPIALNMVAPGLGTIASGALGAGIGTLVQGGNIKDAFKSALIGGAMGGLYSGVQGGLSAASAPGGGSFVEGFQSGIGQAGTDFMNTIGMGAPVPGPGAAPVKPSMASQVRESVTDITPDMPTAGASAQFSPEATANLLPDSQLVLDPATGKLVVPQAPAPAAVPTTQAPVTTAYEPKGFIQSLQEGNLKEAFMPSGPTPDQVALAQKNAYVESYNSLKDLPGMTPEIAASKASEIATASVSDMGPGLIRSYAPLAAVGAGIAAKSGFFDTPEPEEPKNFFEDQTRYAAMTPEERRNYQIANLTGGPEYTNPYLVDIGREYSPRNPSLFQPMTYAATGGEMVNFPRRNGAISGPGTETSDDVPAMLSDGEFVMTARAVRGAGNGDREAGVKTMHNLMKAFEMGVA